MADDTEPRRGGEKKRKQGEISLAAQRDCCSCSTDIGRGTPCINSTSRLTTESARLEREQMRKRARTGKGRMGPLLVGGRATKRTTANNGDFRVFFLQCIHHLALLIIFLQVRDVDIVAFRQLQFDEVGFRGGVQAGHGGVLPVRARGGAEDGGGGRGGRSCLTRSPSGRRTARRRRSARASATSSTPCCRWDSATRRAPSCSS